MAEIDFATYDLDTPSGRQSLLRGMPPDRETARKYRSELLDLFRREADFRRQLGEASDSYVACRDDEIDYDENLYWCALLLYLVGDPADVPSMWEAKHITWILAAGSTANSWSERGWM